MTANSVVPVCAAAAGCTKGLPATSGAACAGAAGQGPLAATAAGEDVADGCTLSAHVDAGPHTLGGAAAAAAVTGAAL